MRGLAGIVCVALLTASATGGAAAAAAAWPEGRAVTIVVPFTAGGGTDIIARQL